MRGNIQTVQIASDTESITQVELAFERVAKRYKLPKDRCGEILLSLYEGVTNAILHGNKKDKNKTVCVAFEHKAQQVCIKISDEGDGFNPSSVPDPTCSANVCICGGRGLFLMQQFSDSMQYHNEGRTVELIFNLA